ncbi:MAG: AAA family ATPase, partial [Actinomycetota bacterium]|nr:AAA family ATPase [Actinomycetota bacterium]
MELRIHLAGPVRVEVDGVVVDDTGLGSLGRLTLAFLVSERHRPVPTDELAEALWGEELPPTWRTALRGLASKLRVFLARAGLDRAQILASGAGWYQLCLPESVVVDVEEAETSLAVAEEALRAARAGVVGRADGARAAADVALEVASPPFLVAARGAWVERRQAELAEVRLRALEASAEACTLAGDSAQGVARAEEAVSLDPWRESAYVRLMVAHAASGNRGAALRAYERCRRLLADELGVRPSLQTERAYVDLLGAEPADALSTDANSVRPSLPLPLTSFVGREGERIEVRRLLGGTRLVTLTGPGGVGKSRLALEVARELEGEDADTAATDAVDGVALVELAPLADPQRVPGQVAHVLGLVESAGVDAQRSLVAHLARRRLLLVLDNCEHLVEACAELAQVLLASCPGLRILATSQSRLRVAGEATFTLTPLPVPRSGTVTAEEAAASEAVRLFLARAGEARIGAVLTEDNASAVAQICLRLDGLPLALELAASQVPKLSMEEIAAGLDDRFRLLADGPGTAPTRHQALRATLDWAHERLSDAEARLLARLSVFSGGFTLAAAEAVVPEADGGNDVFPLLSALVDASLVQADPRTRVTRYGLLESVRAYAGERLERSGEAPELRRRHLEWATSLAEEVAPELEGPAQRVGLDRLQAEHANLAAALAWAT